MKLVPNENRYKCIGTAHIDGIIINENESYLFEFKYIEGSDMDAIIGITDNKFTFKQNEIQGVGNDTDCFNWGLRYDGIICYNNLHNKWKTKICSRWSDDDIICVEINTMSLQSSTDSIIRFWMNGQEKSVKLFWNDFDIESPLKISASNARSGGFEIVKGIKCH